VALLNVGQTTNNRALNKKQDTQPVIADVQTGSKQDHIHMAGFELPLFHLFLLVYQLILVLQSSVHHRQLHAHRLLALCSNSASALCAHLRLISASLLYSPSQLPGFNQVASPVQTWYQ
jgi:hypothetical protein